MAYYYSIVHGAESKIPRRVIRTEDALPHPSHAGPGEAVMTLGPGHFATDPVSCRNYITQHYGVTHESIPSGRCVLVHPETMLVEHVIMADPAIDTHPTHKIIASDEAHQNWKLVGNKPQPRHVVISPDGVVTKVDWGPLPATASGHRAEFSDAAVVGDNLGGIVNAPSQGTRKL